MFSSAKMLLSALFLSAFTLTLSAQDAPPMGEAKREARAQARIARLDSLQTILGLTPDQRAQIDKIDQEHRADMDQNKQMDKEARKQKVGVMEGRIKAVLTPEQKTKYEEFKAKEKAARKANKMDDKKPKKEAKPGKSTGQGKGKKDKQ
jgi:Spy/CpxP family protein refolding chaperone